jgi:tetratricopeptide (TPR) repeat protein
VVAEQSLVETRNRRIARVARRGLRRVGLGLAVLVALLAGADARATGLVLPPRAPTDLATVANGATEWIRARFQEAGLPSSAGFAMSDALPMDRAIALPPAASLRALGTQSGAERAWGLDLDADRGKAIAQLVVVDLGSGSMIAAGRVDTTIAKLGTAIAEITDAVIAQSGATGRTLEAPSLWELDRYGRSIAAMNAGRLADAWRVLGKMVTPTSQALRAQLEAAGRSDQSPLAERARLAAVRGDSQRARLWLRSEHGTNRDDELLALASAEAAEEMGEVERSLPLYDRAIALDPNSQAARAGRARMLLAAGRTEEALAAVAELGDPDTTLLETAVELPSLEPSARAQLHFRLGDQLGARFDSERAVHNFEQAALTAASLAGLA